MTDAVEPTLFTARTEPDQLQVDAWSHEPLLLSLEMGEGWKRAPVLLAAKQVAHYGYG